ncbi:type II toxin-antitoxin system toxin DNA ADP-ribosyl transferase DarT [Bradyrhizobium amphicarpaeae]|uniref:DUF4433 domain-containing protein n=1 Tax=Bradyrhizobium amphicarpaeae TaxID=1404768 RepID=A0A2U8PMC8_9BRAD|nr:DUF4433 domain-containing protein [Bradyrhizobium amphicarpaeae]AWL98624.1 DUF4433 domain-containing protein [Bradyrhizobium amphicarpaeae]
MPVPAQPKIYHIVHIDNLASIVADGCLWSDKVMVGRGGPPANIGMPTIKAARLIMSVPCHDGTFVGEYVPFNFCPRSVMLSIIWYANHPNLTYRGGQEPIIHLEADLLSTVAWAEKNNRRWAFSLANARAAYTQFRTGADRFGDINWNAVATSNFKAPDVKEAKQAEFLVEESFPWHLVDRIGVHSQEMATRASAATQSAAHKPPIEVKRGWYY